MFNIGRTRVLSIMAIYPFSSRFESYDVDKLHSHVPVKSDETGMDRLRQMFTLEEGLFSPEIRTVISATTLSFIVGGFLGGFMEARGVLGDFIDNNHATAFQSHLDAKRALRDHFTVKFLKGAMKWSAKISAFTLLYMSTVTVISVYRGKSSVLEYSCGGALAGLCFKLHLGLRGAFAGTVIGGALGTVCGLVSILLLKVSGVTMEELRYWNYHIHEKRDQVMLENMKKLSKSEAKQLVEELRAIKASERAMAKPEDKKVEKSPEDKKVENPAEIKKDGSKG